MSKHPLPENDNFDDLDLDEDTHPDRWWPKGEEEDEEIRWPEENDENELDEYAKY